MKVARLGAGPRGHGPVPTTVPTPARVASPPTSGVACVERRLPAFAAHRRCQLQLVSGDGLCCVLSGNPADLGRQAGGAYMLQIKLYPLAACRGNYRDVSGCLADGGGVDGRPLQATPSTRASSLRRSSSSRGTVFQAWLSDLRCVRAARDVPVATFLSYTWGCTTEAWMMPCW